MVNRACHWNLDDDQEPQPCVLQQGNSSACPIAERLGQRGLTQTACEYWLPVNGPARNPLLPDDQSALQAHARLSALPRQKYRLLQASDDIERMAAVGPPIMRILRAVELVGHDLTVTDLREETGLSADMIKRTALTLVERGAIVQVQRAKGQVAYRSRLWLD